MMMRRSAYRILRLVTFFVLGLLSSVVTYAEKPSLHEVEYVPWSSIPVGVSGSWQDLFDSIEPITYSTPSRRVTARGTVRLVDGTAASNAVVLLIDASQGNLSQSKLLRRVEDDLSLAWLLHSRSVIAKTRADEEGRFAFEQVGTRVNQPNAFGHFWTLLSIGSDGSLGWQKRVHVSRSKGTSYVDPIVWEVDSTDVLLRPSIVVNGKVLDGEGNPVSDAIVEANSYTRRPSTNRSTYKLMTERMNFFGKGFPTEVRTNREGLFSFSAMFSNQICNVSAFVEGKKFDRATIWTGEPNELIKSENRGPSVSDWKIGEDLVLTQRDPQLNELQIQKEIFGQYTPMPTAKVSGRLIDDETNEPVSNATICFFSSLDPPKPLLADDTVVAEVDSEGHFTADVAKAEGLRLVVCDSLTHEAIDPRVTQSTAALKSLSHTVNWPEDSTQWDLGDIPIAAKPLIRVIVRNPDGEPSTNSVVSVFGTDAKTNQRTELCPPLRQDSATANRLVLSHSRSDSLFILAEDSTSNPPGYARLELPKHNFLNPDMVHEVVLLPAAELVGNVRLDGEPLAGAMVSVSRRKDSVGGRGGSFSTTPEVYCKTDENGMYRAIVEPKQRYMARVVDTPSDMPTSQVGYFAEPRGSIQYHVRPFDLESPEKQPGTIKGQVTDTQGSPLEGSTVMIRQYADRGRPNLAVPMPSTKTDSQGRFELKGVKPLDAIVLIIPPTERQDEFINKNLKASVGDDLNIKLSRKPQTDSGRFLPKSKPQ
ncbi:MAG: hypothetical protein AAF664_10465 [Planctomycetota bacterium]